MNWRHRAVRWALGACLSMGLALAIAPASYAQTADGETPAQEDICTKWGMTGQVNGLCNAYCEAMDCDAAEPQASDQACTRVLSKIEDALGGTPFPTCEDVDDDGTPNGIDNCPDVANADQSDTDGNGTGDACEAPDPNDCPGLGAEGVPSTAEALLADAVAFHNAYPNPGPNTCTRGTNEAWYREIRIADDPGAPTPTRMWSVQVTVEPRVTIVTRFAVFDQVFTGDDAARKAAACQALVELIQDSDPFGICPQ